MSGIGSWLWGTSQLDDAVDKATSELIPAGAEDIALNLEICDQIRSKAVPAKDAMRALKRRLNHKNPNVQLLALGLTDICIKNGGDHFLNEVTSREFIDNLVSILKIPALNLEVKNNILRLIQNWSVAFEGKPALSYVGQVYKTLSSEGYKFPPKDLVVASSAMVDTQTAPEWVDSDICLRCRTPFSFTNRKHHCRNCGQVFDQQCSSKSMALPHFGITQEVRVCDGCHSKLSKKNDKAGTNKGHRHSTSLHGTRHRSAHELADAELQRAIQLSLEEVGAANGYARPGYVPFQPSPSNWQYSEPPIVDRSTRDVKTAIADDEEDDPDLRAAIEASLREANAPKPSAPIALDTPRTEEPAYSYAGPGYSHSYPPGVVPPQPSLPQLPNYDLEPLESDAILTFSQTVEQVQAQGGRDISRYPAVTELYDKATSLRPKLALSLDDTGRKEQMLSDMHDKLSQAVKLYDQLLTEQVAHPRWRSPQPVVTTPYQQANSSYSTGYNTVNGYTQWGPAGYQVPPAVEPHRQPQSPHMSYAAAPSVHEYQNQQYTASTPHAESSKPLWAPQQQQQHAESSQQQSQYGHSGQQYTPAAPHPVSVQPPQSQYQSSYPEPTATPIQAQPLAPVSYAARSQPLAPSPPSLQTSPTIPTSAPPMILPQSPPPIQQQYAVSSPSQPVAPTSHIPSLPLSSLSPLTRHNTVSYAPSHHPAPAHLGRSNTVASPPGQQRHASTAFSQQEHQYASAPPPPPVTTTMPSTLPQFPAVPTATPQTYSSMYGQSIPSSITRTEERKEALLIDL